MEHLLALDIGTSSIRAMIFDSKFKIKETVQMEVKLFSPQNGWVEQDPLELWGKSKEVLEKVLAVAQKNSWLIKGLAITNQRETVIAWYKSTGQPIYPAIVWQDRRTADYCMKLQKRGIAEKIYKKTGLRVDPYFSASKINWILNNIPESKKAFKENDLLVGTVDSWIIWNLTGREQHLTDVSNASRTMLFNIRSLKWDSDLLKIFGVPASILPKVISSASNRENFGLALVGGREVPILAVCGDQTSALFGEGCLRSGDTKATYGTGGFVVVNIGEKIKVKTARLVTTIAWQIDDKIIYALEGSIFQSGGTLKWLRDNLQLFKDYEEINILSQKVKDSGGVYLVPAFVGLGAPYWLPDARGIIMGLNNQTRKEHIVNAAIEAAAFQVNEILEIIKREYKLKIGSLKVDGGLVKSDYLLNFQAGVSGVTVYKSANEEMTAKGVALMAGRILNWSTPVFTTEKAFRPSMSNKERMKKIIAWRHTVKLACQKRENII